MKPLARVGDKHVCPVHGVNVIVSGTSQVLDGRPIAAIGSKCACGAVILTGSASMIVDGKPAALIGSKTSCGGTIASGSSAGNA